jgi:hypothetical protein
MIIYKRTDGTAYFGWDFGPELPEGEVILGTSAVKVSDSDGTDVTSTFVKKTIIDGSEIDVLINKVGVEGKDYQVKFIGKTDNLDPVHAITLKVRDSG